MSGLNVSKLYASTVLLGLLFAPDASASTWDFGTKTKAIIGETSGPLQQTISQNSLDDYDFVKSVGGIAFAAQAQPSTELQGKAISLSYDPTRLDGERLAVTLGAKTYVAEIPDWQLVPIVRYADSEYNACVSLFGANANDDYYDLVYHSAFQHTLLGLRLLQADILLMNLGEHWELPKMDGKTYLGSGENLPQREVSLKAAESLSVAMTTDREQQSWILTDVSESVEYGISTGGRLELTGDPYFYFWKDDRASYDRQTDQYQGQISSLRQQITRDQEKLADLNTSLEGLVNEHNELVGQANALIERQNEMERDVLEKKLADFQSRMGAKKAEIETLQSEADRLHDATSQLADRHKATTLRHNELRPEVHALDELTNSMRARRTHLRDFNPAVYTAAQNVMRFAALFRYVKSQNGQNWTRFTNQVRSVAVEPAVQTPTRLAKAKTEQASGQAAE